MDCDMIVIFFIGERENGKSRVRTRSNMNGGERDRERRWGGVKVRAD